MREKQEKQIKLIRECFCYCCYGCVHQSFKIIKKSTHQKITYKLVGISFATLLSFCFAETINSLPERRAIVLNSMLKTNSINVQKRKKKNVYSMCVFNGLG